MLAFLELKCRKRGISPSGRADAVCRRDHTVGHTLFLFILFIVLNKISTFLFNTNDILNIFLLSRPYLTRHTQYDVDELLASTQIKLITGPRRTGKSTEVLPIYKF